MKPSTSGAGRPFLGIGVLVLSSWALSGLDASGKWVMGAGVSLLMLCWVRYVVHLFLVLGLVLPARGAKVLRTKRPAAQITRGGVMLLATLSFFTTLRYLPQAEATAINFLAPLIMLAVAPWVLKEPARLSRWLAAGVGFLGVLIIIRPDAGLHPLGTVFGLLTACLFATQFIATRRLAAEDPFTTLVWSGAVGSVLLTIALPFVWPTIRPMLAALDAWQWLILLSTGFWGALGHLLQIQAYRYAPASMLAPFLYLQIVSAATLGWLIWGQFPDPLTWLGIAVICASGVTIALVEWRGRKPA
ncbi:DMT family transporter [Parapusillimonas granuli]|uniref:DMT family transporter n=1 Tax=Parapusillimonas granuli TaxID=380911 RepID=A0A853G5H0_9BURK|nr:DMT family transporter [Parapusillimonas granuli]MBB5215497.1 drug/metabolite transporter (DMT)-like permease [Parapusillimonas granuli]MEB2400334.1 DMT family transporter [Alcaligenaceae bacterium]NYT49836.1 DMT family transporter [Parapusillimonas granuli]